MNHTEVTSLVQKRNDLIEEIQNRRNLNRKFWKCNTLTFLAVAIISTISLTIVGSYAFKINKYIEEVNIVLIVLVALTVLSVISMLFSCVKYFTLKSAKTIPLLNQNSV